MVLRLESRNSDPHDDPILPWEAAGREAGSPFSLTFSDVQFARIHALRQRIAAGTYRVPTAALADVLMGRMLVGRMLVAYTPLTQGG